MFWPAWWESVCGMKGFNWWWHRQQQLSTHLSCFSLCLCYCNFWWMREAVRTPLALFRSRTVSKQLKHMVVTGGSLWLRTELALATLDERLITLIWVDFLKWAQRVIGFSKEEHILTERIQLARKVTDIYFYKFWQMLFVFKWHHDAEGFSEQWLIMCTWLSIASTRGA